MKHLKITVGLLLLVQAVQLAAPQTTRSVPTIDASWLRRLTGEPNRIQGDVVEEREQDNGNDFTSGTSSGAMEEEHMVEQGRSATELATIMNVTESPAVQNVTMETTEPPRRQTTALPPATANATAGQTEAGNDVNSTSAPQNVTSVPYSSNSSNATSAPEVIPSAKPDEESTNNTGFSNSTAGTNNTGFSNSTAGTNNTGAETNETSTVSPSVSVKPESTAWIPATTAVDGRVDESTGDTAGRGSALDLQNNARQQAWGAVLATAVAVACVGLVAYIILKKKYPKGFTHRKLVEEYPSDPVLRLDNSEPLDLNFGHLGYHNPGLHGDDIQMSRIPGRP